MEFLEFKKITATEQETESKPKPPLGERLRQIRQEIVSSGEPLLDWEGVEPEKAERRGGYRENFEWDNTQLARKICSKASFKSWVRQIQRH